MTDIVVLDNGEPVVEAHENAGRESRLSPRMIAMLLVIVVGAVAGTSAIRGALREEKDPAEAILVELLGPVLMVREADGMMREVELDGRWTGFDVEVGTAGDGIAFRETDEGWLVPTRTRDSVQLVLVPRDAEEPVRTIFSAGEDTRLGSAGDHVLAVSSSDATVLDLSGRVLLRRPVDGTPNLSGDGSLLVDSKVDGVVVWDVVSGERVIDAALSSPGGVLPVAGFGSVMWLEQVEGSTVALNHRDPSGATRTVLDDVGHLRAIHAGPDVVVFWQDASFDPSTIREVDPVQVWSTSGQLASVDVGEARSIDLVPLVDSVAIVISSESGAGIVEVSGDGVVSPRVDLDLPTDLLGVAATKTGRLLFIASDQPGSSMTTGYIDLGDPASEDREPTLVVIEDRQPFAVLDDLLVVARFDDAEFNGGSTELAVLGLDGSLTTIATDVNPNFLARAGSAIYYRGAGDGGGVHRVDLSGDPPQLIAERGTPHGGFVFEEIASPDVLFRFDFSRRGG